MPLIRGRVGFAAKHVCAAPGRGAGASVVSVEFTAGSPGLSGWRERVHARPRWPPQPAQTISERTLPNEKSVCTSTLPPTLLSKAGQPQLLSNLEPALYSGSAQPAHAKCPPAGLNCTYSPLNGCSVPPVRSTWNWSRVSVLAQSASLLARGPSSLSSRRLLPRPRTAATRTAAPPAVATATAAGRRTVLCRPRRSAASMLAERSKRRQKRALLHR